MTNQSQILRILILEDVPADAELMERELKKSGLTFTSKRVETEKDYIKELNEFQPDLILADYRLPSFDGLSALAIAQELSNDVPFIFVSGTLGEELAIDTLKKGATDYVVKQRLSRLGAVVQRAFTEINEKINRKQTEEALFRSETKYRSIFENAIEGIFQTAPEGRFMTVNPAMAYMHGFASPEEMTESITDIGKQLYVNPEDRERYRAILEEKGEVNNYEAQTYRKDGNIIWTSTNARAIKDAAGCVIRFEGTAEDITARKQAEDALNESEKHYRSLFENMLNGFAYCQMCFDDNDRPCDFIYLSVNDAFETLTGLRNVVGKKITEVIPGIREADPELLEIYGRVSRTGKPERFEILVDSLQMWFWVSAYSPERGYFVAVFDVITERKRAEESLQNTMEKLRKSLAGTIQVMSTTVETRDPYTAGHQRRVSKLARDIAQDMGLSNDTIENIRMAGIIHDIGKISVPAEILVKPGKISDIEMSLIRVHPQSGYDILKDVELPYPIAEIVLQHHERLDGSGYPSGLKDGDIFLEARIVSVADVVEAISSHRPYRPALGIDVALEEIEKNKGILYDEKAVETCLKLFREKQFSFE